MSEAPDVYSKDGVVYYRASSLGGCTRDLVAARLGIHPAPAPKKLEGWWEEGRVSENLIVDYLESIGKTVRHQQMRVELPVGDGLMVVGHIDGITDLDDVASAVLEGKALGKTFLEQYEYGGFKAMGTLGRVYAWQISCYMLALGMPALYAVRSKVTGATTTKEIHTPPVGLAQIVQKVAEVEKYARAEEYPECDGGCTAWSSRYWGVHETEEVPDRPELYDVIARYAEQKELVDDHQAYLAELKEELVERMGTGKARAEEFEVSISNVVSRRPDTKKLKQALGEEYEDYTYETRSTRLTVRRTGRADSSE